MKPLFLSLFLTSLPYFCSASQPKTLESGPGQVHLVELYTSEGCSSCPPAEEWLSHFLSSPELWTKVVPVAFHVNYWDNLGWPDAFASKQFTNRQYDYSSHWGTSSVYTPGVVLDGREARGWRDPLLISNLENASPGKLRVEIQEKNVLVSFNPSAKIPADLVCQVALLGNQIISSVKGGENSGRDLQHDFVVLAMNTAPLTLAPDGNRYTATLPLPERASRARLALAVWVEDPDSGRPLQALGGELTPKSE